MEKEEKATEETTDVPTTRERIIQAALTVFAEKGLHGATVVEIAKSAGITGGAMYRYFDSKEEIFRAVIAKHSVAFQALDLIKSLLPELEPRTALKFISQGMFTYIYSDMVFIRMVLVESMKNPENTRPFFEVMGTSREVLQECFEAWKEKGLIRPELNTGMATLAFLGMLGYLLVEKDIFANPDLEDIDLDDFLDQNIDLFLHGILL
jgi:AcrR family transcriptional regulator